MKRYKKEHPIIKYSKKTLGIIIAIVAVPLLMIGVLGLFLANYVLPNLGIDLFGEDEDTYMSGPFRGMSK